MPRETLTTIVLFSALLLAFIALVAGLKHTSFGDLALLLGLR